jgi:hypothetical protein
VTLDLSSAFILFVEEAYNFPGNGKWDTLKVISALRHKIKLLATIKMECEMLIKKLLSMVDQTKKDLKMSGWLHMPPTSDEYQYYKLLCGDYEADGYESLGMISCFDQTEASDKRPIKNYQKGRVIYNLLGLEDRAKLTDIRIAALKDRLARCDGVGVDVAVNASTLLKGARYNYEYLLKICGSTSEATLRSGLWYVTELVQAHHGRS